MTIGEHGGNRVRFPTLFGLIDGLLDGYPSHSDIKFELWPACSTYLQDAEDYSDFKPLALVVWHAKRNQ